MKATSSLAAWFILPVLALACAGTSSPEAPKKAENQEQTEEIQLPEGPVKIMRIMQYDFYDGERSENGWKLQESYFIHDSLEIRQTRFNREGGKVVTMENTYDEEGRIASQKQISGTGKVGNHQSRTYTASGKQKELWTHIEGRPPYLRQKFLYDDHDSLIKIEWYTANQQIETQKTLEWERSPTGRLIQQKESVIMGEKSLQNYWVHLFNVNGEKSRSTRFNGQGEKEKEFLNEFDDQGRITTIYAMRQRRDFIQDIHATYSYDAEGRVTKWERYDNGKAMDRYEYEYNEQGQKTQELYQSKFPGQEMNDYRLEVSYDKEGRKVLESRFVGPKLIFGGSQKYEYNEDGSIGRITQYQNDPDIPIAVLEYSYEIKK